MAFIAHLAVVLAFSGCLVAEAAVSKTKGSNGAKLCKEEPDIIVERSLAQTGYHRELQTVVHARNRLKVKGRPPTLLLLETIPAGAFVDAHQLKLLDESDAMFGLREKVDIEEMAHQAKSHNVFTYLSVNETSALAALPVHMRYHKAQNCLTDGSFTKVTLQPPSVYFRHLDLDFPDICEDLHHLPCDAANMERTCLWKQLKVASLSSLSAEVPVGCLEDGFLVSVITLVTYSLCSIAIAYYVCIHGKKPRSD